MPALIWLITGAATVVSALKYLADKQETDNKQTELGNKIVEQNLKIQQLEQKIKSDAEVRAKAVKIIEEHYKPEEDDK
jgi:hypothetical protein